MAPKDQVLRQGERFKNLQEFAEKIKKQMEDRDGKGEGEQHSLDRPGQEGPEVGKKD